MKDILCLPRSLITLLLKMPFKTAKFMTLSACCMRAGEDRGLENQLLLTRGFFISLTIQVFNFKAGDTNMFQDNHMQVCCLSLELIFPLLSTLQFNVFYPFTHTCHIEE